MKGASLIYLTKDGFRNIWVNRLLTLATVVVLVSCLVIVGSGSLIFLNINSLLDLVEGQNVVMVYVNDNADNVATQLLGTQLKSLDNVKKDGVLFVPKEEAFERQKELYGENSDILNGLSAEILPDAYKVTVEDLEFFDDTVAKIKSLDNVIEVHENSDLAGKLASIRNGVTYVSAGIVMVLFFVSLFIVANTIRITIYNRRLEISIMKSVGATNTFIRWPFIVEGVMLGIFSAVIALALQYGIYSLASIWLNNILSMLGGKAIDFIDVIWYLLGIFVFIGVIIGTFGSLISLNRYLKEHSNVVEAN